MSIESIDSLLDLIALPIPDFVDTSYHVLLGRNPSPPERSERAGAVREGLGRTRFLADICVSPEYRQRWEQVLGEGDDVLFIHAMFRRYLNRPADRDGIEHYINVLSKGKSRTRMARDIAASREARTTHAFWLELDRLVAAERAERHWLRRWFGHGRRARMLRNLTQEAQMQHVPRFIGGSHGFPTSQPAQAPVSQPRPVAVTLVADKLSQGYGSRRVLSRLRYATGAM